MKKKTTAKEALEMQKRAGIITESAYKNKLKTLLEAEEVEDDDEEDTEKDASNIDDKMNKISDYLKNLSQPNPNPPVWKSVLAVDKKMLSFIDKKIKELYKGAEKLEDIGNPVWLSDKEADVTIPIAVYKWNDPNKPEDVPDFESAQEAVEWYDENSLDLDLDPWTIEIAVQKHVDTGDIGYWEIMASGETSDPYGEPNGWLTGDYAEDSNKKTNSNIHKKLPIDSTKEEIEEYIAEYMKNGGQGDLNLDSVSITSLPKGLKVGGTLNLMNTAIVSLPDNLEVVGSLILYYTPIKSLPKNLKVGKNLYLTNSITGASTNITSLPNGLEANYLEISPSKISSLPKDMKVKEINIKNTPLEKYTEKEIKAMAPSIKKVYGAAESSTYKIATSAGLPKGTKDFPSSTEFGDRTNE
jgi:hypothetical protein